MNSVEILPNLLASMEWCMKAISPKAPPVAGIEPRIEKVTGKRVRS